MEKEPRELATLDCETDPFLYGRIPAPFIWGLKTKDKFCIFTDTKSMIEYVSKKPLTIYAHNGGKFDFLFLKDYLEAGTELRIIHGRLAQFKIGKALFRDSFCIFPMGLKNYKKDDFDYSMLEAKNREKNWDKIIQYLEHDCEYLFDLVSDFVNKYGQRLTLAASAMKFWSDNRGIKPPKSNKQYYETFSPFYHGGRVQCFKHGVFNKKIQTYDINSAYPFAMLHPHPWGFKAVQTATLPKNNIHLCMIKLRAEGRGYFPIKTKNGTEFPDDKLIYEFNITGYEYLTARDIDPKYKMEILECYQFQESITFDDYINYFYDMKKKAAKESTDYLFAKLMMNSLYGKFGANPEKYKRYMVCEPKDYPFLEATSDYILSDLIYPWALMEAPLSEMQRVYYDVATAASITGFVRAYLLAHMQKAKNVYYCDTDCIHAESLECEQGKELGQWTHEFTALKAAYGGKKMYALVNGKKNKTATKGARLSVEDIFKVCKGETVLYKRDAPTMTLKGGTRFISRKIKMT